MFNVKVKIKATLSDTTIVHWVVRNDYFSISSLVKVSYIIIIRG